MSPIGDHLQTMRGAILGGALLVASSAAGLVWLSIAVVGGIAPTLGQFWASVTAGFLLLSPLGIFTLIVWLRDQQRQSAALAVSAGDDTALGTIVAASQKLIEKSPLAALVLASLAGLTAARFPTALTLFASVLKEYDRSSETPAATP
jgi:hypothetical protein